MSDFDLKEFLRLKDLAQSKRRALDRAQGERDALLTQLQNEFSCKSSEEAQKLYAKLMKQKDALETEISDKITAYRKNFGGK